MSFNRNSDRDKIIIILPLRKSIRLTVVVLQQAIHHSYRVKQQAIHHSYRVKPTFIMSSSKKPARVSMLPPPETRGTHKIQTIEGVTTATPSK